jgi:hypothetical protein
MTLGQQNVLRKVNGLRYLNRNFSNLPWSSSVGPYEPDECFPQGDVIHLFEAVESFFSPAVRPRLGEHRLHWKCLIPISVTCREGKGPFPQVLLQNALRFATLKTIVTTRTAATFFNVQVAPSCSIDHRYPHLVHPAHVQNSICDGNHVELYTSPFKLWAKSLANFKARSLLPFLRTSHFKQGSKYESPER